jgi:hypothetical protein
MTKEPYNNPLFLQFVLDNEPHQLLSDYELDKSFEDFMDSVYDEPVTICGYEYSQAEALKAVDPIAYRCAQADYCSEYFIEITAKLTGENHTYYLSTEIYDSLVDDFEAEQSALEA